jgi:phosphatidylinositol glycan class C protein
MASHHTGVKAVKSSILIFLALMSLSPVLKTLTAATSSDSIWALSAILFGINALLADYSAISLGGGEVHERSDLPVLALTLYQPLTVP